MHLIHGTYGSYGTYGDGRLSVGYERASGQVETQGPVRSLGDSDAGADGERAARFTEGGCGRIADDDKCGTSVAQVRAVQAAVNLQGGAEFSGAVCQRQPGAAWAVGAHNGFAEFRFHRANKHCFRLAGGAANGVDAMVIAIDEVNISAPWRAVHRPVPGCFTGETM